MTFRARTFPGQASAAAAGKEHGQGDATMAMPLGREWYVKRSQPQGVEPLYLADDGLWRRYDELANLPGSSAAA